MTTSAALAHLEKTAADRLDYDIDFAKWLTDDDTIMSAYAVLLTPEVSFVIDTVEVTDKVVRVWIMGGLDGELSEVAVYASTVVGRIKEARFEMQIKDG